MAATSLSQVLLLGDDLRGLRADSDSKASGSSGTTLSLVFLPIFVAEALVVAILVVLLTPHQFRFQPNFDLPRSALTCPDHTPMLLFGSLSPLLTPDCFLFAFKVSQGLICRLKFLLQIFPLISLKYFTQWHNSP